MGCWSGLTGWFRKPCAPLGHGGSNPSPTAMDDEVLVSTAVVFKTRAGKNSWLLVKLDSNEAWQLPKGVVRRTESSVRAAIRTLSELAGVRGRVLEEVGKTSSKTGRNGKILTRRIIYYLMQQRGKDDGVIGSARTSWVNARKLRGKLKSTPERRIIFQARKLLVEWQKQEHVNY